MNECAREFFGELNIEALNEILKFLRDVYSIKGTLSWVDMRERLIQNLKKSAWCSQVERSHFQYGVD